LRAEAFGHPAAVIWLLLLPVVALGAEPDATAIAARASEAHERLCSDVAAAQSTKSFEASAEVSAVLAEVSRTYDRTPEPWLLYWRGLLAGCAEREERAIEDLKAFVVWAADEPSLASQVQDAKRRLRRYGIPDPTLPERGASSAAPGIAVGAGLLGAGGALGALAGWQASILSTQQENFEQSTLPWDERVAEYGEPGQRTASRTNGLLSVGIGCGVGGAVALAITAATGKRGPGVAVLPTEGGAVVSFGGQW
jgi:hypothetical protein